ncbi:uncharacterized protein BP5553_03107 [Venustampulla echinocandica]|uniref:RTA1-domain-containing protein n=1 Tax=Venustampulla echinocandica TaxID=2656787 RepID=A0A370TTA9_9HELO|nr:uncharacterized protein BP5553_03107 [Venustampulla echinocandica]RDL38767.1 hypothetical protein BP5553_03107 [Venustampulla echinocandica]
MNLLSHVLFLVASGTAANAFILSTPYRTPTPTLLPRDNSPSTTAAPTGYFMTTKYQTIDGVTQDHVTISPVTITLVIPTCIHTTTPDKNGYVPPGTCGALYNYYPSLVGATITAAVFGVLTGLHIWLAAKWKAKYCWVLIMGTIWETLSFIFRSISTRNQQSVGLELMSSLFVLLAPLWINAHCYITLSHLLYTVHPTRSILHIPAQTLSIIFVILDFASFVIQLIGGSYASPTAPENTVMKGIHIYMGGIGIQQFFIVLFIGLTVKFHIEMIALEKTSAGNIIGGRRDWKKLLYAIYASLCLVTIRIIFRFVQYNSGNDPATHPLIGQEVYLYILEALPMMGAVACFIIVHPGGIVDAHMPGIWQAMKRSLCGRRRVNRGRREAVEEDNQELTTGKYVELEGSPYGRR